VASPVPALSCTVTVSLNISFILLVIPDYSYYLIKYSRVLAKERCSAMLLRQILN